MEKSARPCLVEGCIREAKNGRACRMHAQRKYKTGDYGPPGPLLMHEMDQRQLKPPRFCIVEGCPNRHKGRGYCATHLLRFRKTGDPGPAQLLRRRKGEGGRNQGYVTVKVNGRQTTQHKVVMEQVLGRPLRPEENVHHINGVRDDNRPENLELWSKSQPAGQRVADKVAWAIELLELYAPEELARNTLLAVAS